MATSLWQKARWLWLWLWLWRWLNECVPRHTAGLAAWCCSGTILACRPALTFCVGGAVLFEVFDPDGDGYAKEEDVATIFRQLFGTYYDNGQLEAMTHAVFVQADVDADGQLSFREFLRVRAKRLPRATPAAQFHRWHSCYRKQTLHTVCHGSCSSLWSYPCCITGKFLVPPSFSSCRQ